MFKDIWRFRKKARCQRQLIKRCAHRELVRADLRELFDIFAQDDDGSITLAQFTFVLESQLSDDQIHLILEHFDNDLDQRVSFSEFEQAVQGYLDSDSDSSDDDATSSQE